jgi:hypothetical protein
MGFQFTGKIINAFKVTFVNRHIHASLIKLKNQFAVYVTLSFNERLGVKQR